MDGRNKLKRHLLVVAGLTVAALGSVSLAVGQTPPPPPPPPPTTTTTTITTTTTPITTTGTPSGTTPVGSGTPSVSSAPEPASLLTALVGTGMVSFAAWRRRKPAMTA